MCAQLRARNYGGSMQRLASMRRSYSSAAPAAAPACTLRMNALTSRSLRSLKKRPHPPSKASLAGPARRLRSLTQILALREATCQPAIARQQLSGTRPAQRRRSTGRWVSAVQLVCAVPGRSERRVPHIRCAHTSGGRPRRQDLTSSLDTPPAGRSNFRQPHIPSSSSSTGRKTCLRAFSTGGC